MTVLIVAILGDRTKAEWQDWVAERYEKNVGYATPREFVNPFAHGPRGAAGEAGKSGPPGSLSMALGGAGLEERESVEEEGAGASSSAALRSIQQALRAQGINIAGLGDVEDNEDHPAALAQPKFSEVVDAHFAPPTLTQTPPPL